MRNHGNIYLDKELQLEAFEVRGYPDKFPSHSHEYYEFGYLISEGTRSVTYMGNTLPFRQGEMIMFNPNEFHTCCGESDMDFLSLHIPLSVIQKVFESEICPLFSPCVIRDPDAISCLLDLHRLIRQKGALFEREEKLYFFLDVVIHRYSPTDKYTITGSDEHRIEKICRYLDDNYAKNMCLDDLCKLFGYSKFYLLREFTKYRGVSPYSYLENVRINEAKKLLEAGSPIITISLETGFSHQSHFSNAFKKYTGVTPKQYAAIYRNDVLHSLEKNYKT